MHRAAPFAACRDFTTFVAILCLTLVAIPGSAEPQKGTLVIAVQKTVSMPDPIRETTQAQKQVHTALFEGLTVYHPETLEPLPGIASAWQTAENGRRMTFFLRTEARFDSGTPVLAADMVASWERLLSPDTGSPYASLLDSVVGAFGYRTGEITDFAKVGIRARGPRILEVDFITPDPAFIKKTSHPALAPVYTARNRLPGDSVFIGNGPFRMEQVTPSGDLVLGRNDFYWDAPDLSSDAAITRIILTVNRDARAVSRSFNSGEIDWILTDFAPDLLSPITSVRQSPDLNANLLVFDSGSAPWNDVRVRRAIASIIPIRLLRALQADHLPDDSIVPVMYGYPTYYPDNEPGKSESMRLLREAGFPEGSGLGPISLSLPDTELGDRMFRLISGAIRDNLGLEVVPARDTEPATVTFTVIRGVYADPGSLIGEAVRIVESGIEGPGTYGELIRRADGEVGRKRYELYSQIEGELIGTGLVIPLSRESTIHVINTDRVAGWYENPLDIHPLKYLSLRRPSLSPGIAMAPRMIPGPRLAPLLPALRLMVSTQTAR